MPLFLNFSPFSLFYFLTSSHILPIFLFSYIHFSLSYILPLHTLALSFRFHFHSFSLFLFLSSGRLKKVFTVYASSAFILSFKYHLTVSQVPLFFPLADGRRFFFSVRVIFLLLLTASVLQFFSLFFFGFSCNL